MYTRRMGRLRRLYLPGGVLHVMARTVRKERLLTPELRTAAVRALADALPRSDARVLAVAIMSNHLHLVIRQGRRPVTHLMQPLLRRLAHRVQVAHGVQGPVFWRPFAEVSCVDPRQARNAIAYVHLNPVRAGLCRDPEDYPWTSHALYAGMRCPAEMRPVAGHVDAGSALPLYATSARRSIAELRQDYLSFLRWRLSLDSAEDLDEETLQDGEAEDVSKRDTPFWGAALSPLFHAPVGSAPLLADTDSDTTGRLDLATLAARIVAAEGNGATVESIRGRGGGREHTRLRRLVVRRLRAAGFRNVDVGRFLNLSESAVSWLALHDPPARKTGDWNGVP